MQDYLLSLSKSYLKNYSGLSRASWVGISINFTVSMLIGVYYFLALYLTSILHFNVATSGFIISSYGVGAVLGGIIAGNLADKKSPGVISAVCLIIQAAAYFTLTKLSSVILLMFDVGAIGVATYGFLTASHFWILRRCRDNEAERLKTINILATAANLGHGISAIIISQAILFGFEYIFVTAGFILFILAGLILTIEINRNESDAEICNAVVGSGANAQKVQLSLSNNRITLGIVLLSVFFVGAVVTQYGSTLAIYINDAFPRLGARGAGILFTTNSLVVVLLGVPLGNLFKNSNKLLMVGVGGLLIGVGMGALVFSNTFAFAIVSCVVYTFGEIIFFSMAQLLCYQSSSVKKRGRGLGVYRMVYAMSRVVGPSAGGVIYLKFGSNMVWTVCAMIGLLCFMSCHYFKNSV